MGKDMDQNKLKALAAELAKDIKSEQDLSALTQQLVKLTVETALNAELDEHLGYEKHAPEGRGTCRIPDDHISQKRYPWFVARDVMQRAIEHFIQQAQGDQPT